jgi:hypothetical protein
MKVKTSELKGHALNWAVARCEGAGSALVDTHSRGVVLLLSDATAHCEIGETYAPSTDWAHGGPIIENEGISVWVFDDVTWKAENPFFPCGVDQVFEGPTPLIAAMRCYVASTLGDEVEVPDSLINI